VGDSWGSMVILIIGCWENYGDNLDYFKISWLAYYVLLGPGG